MLRAVLGDALYMPCPDFPLMTKSSVHQTASEVQNEGLYTKNVETSKKHDRELKLTLNIRIYKLY